MHSKEFALAISLGGDESDYVAVGETGFSIAEIIAPFKASINFIHAKLLLHHFGHGFAYHTNTKFVVKKL
ncbi:hypothetical protein U5B43_01725 [Campylobacter sp. 9BO]|uniref:hypothetical protein n=1 Tax=Campylobacter sp. 9BO TaxID=3424759 RepID=UPI003D33E428